MVNAVSIDTPQAYVLSVSREAAISLNSSQVTTLGVYNVPADAIRITFADTAVD